jgi:hypothetical protein
MQIAEHDYNSLLGRMKKLEGQNRMWKIAGPLVLLTLGLSLTANVTAQQKAQDAPIRATTVEAQKFLLRDTAGTVMGQLTVRDGKPVLELYDVAGKVTWSTKQRVMGAK